MKIIKFGGSSSASAERVKSIIEIVKPELTGNVALVFSAFGGVTDQLISISELALAGKLDYKKTLLDLESRHLEAVRELLPMHEQSAVLAQVKIKLNELENVLQGVCLVRERTTRTLDYIMSFGERLSAYIMTEAFKSKKLDVEYLDARQVIKTDNTFGYAKVDFNITNKLVKDHFKHHTSTQVITGFIASTETGETTTLGRSGSDYTAAIFAGALHASSLEIWTDVDGMMTADPRLVKKSFPVPELSYEEAMELSHFGAKVIFPSTMKPAMAEQIPIWIKNTFNPSARGTRISAQSTNGKLIKGISSMNNISLLNVQGSGLVGVVGVAMRVFSTLAREKINVVLISQASSEHSICIAIETSSASAAKSFLEKEFLHEIREALIDTIAIESNLSILAVVGDSMKHHPGSSGRLFSALGKSGVNVMAIAQGSSERNISAVVRQADVAKAINVLHDAFFLSDTKTVNLFLVGTGLVGGTLLEQLTRQAKTLLHDHHLDLRVTGIANSKKMLFNELGIDTSSWPITLKQDGFDMNSEKFFDSIIKLNLPNSIFIDCTSSEKVITYYSRMLSANISIVTPNKKANSASFDTYVHLKQLARKRSVRFLYETNVGAGLPVINTLTDLLLSGDSILKIEGVLSGTLNYIFSSFTGEKPFSEIVKEAKDKGFTEPDPRDDLSGMDVARKILILAREAGASLELSDVSIENLVPQDCRDVKTAEEFLTKLSSHDGYFQTLAKQATSQNKKLRYKAVIENNKASVQLASVDEHHPFYSLSGSDNIILITTERYRERPLVIRGPGAGAEVTAAGVFADIIRIGNYTT
jgi:bifunctional aspartokinase / homoserine dehydrogenase 1